MLIKRDSDAIKSYFEDSSNLKGGYADAVVFPENADSLRHILMDANARRMPVTVSGGGTGTTGGRIPFGGIVVSFERFNRTLDISSESMSARVDSGVIVEDFKAACERRGLFYTSHPTEKTALVGGTVATNASGSRSFKYGPTRKYVKHLKMVMATGEPFDIERGERIITADNPDLTLNSGRTITIPIPSYRIPSIKNSAGYFVGNGTDLIDIFIGQEGTISLLTEIEFELVKKPSGILSVFVFFKRKTDAWRFAEEVRAISKREIQKTVGLLDALSIEYFDNNALRLLAAKNDNVPSSADAAIFFEQEMADKREDVLVDEWLKLILSYNVPLNDTWVAMNESEADDFAELRHYIPEAVNDIVRRNGFQKLSTDIAVPSERFAEMMNFYAAVFRDCGIEHVVFGHIGECHVHTNLLPKSAPEFEKAKDICLELVKKGLSLGGTISAEHGVGKTKHKYLEMMYGEKGVIEMARVKKAFDPNCILGLDNIFPRGLLSRV